MREERSNKDNKWGISHKKVIDMFNEEELDREAEEDLLRMWKDNLIDTDAIDNYVEKRKGEMAQWDKIDDYIPTEEEDYYEQGN